MKAFFTRNEPTVSRTVNDIISVFTTTISQLRSKRSELLTEAEVISDKVEILKIREEDLRKEASRAEVYADKIEALLNN